MMDPTEGNEAGLFSALTTSLLVTVTLLVTFSSYSMFWHNDLAWGQTAIALSGATAIVLLSSVMFSFLGNAKLSKASFVLGVVLLMVVVAMNAIEMIDRVTGPY